MIFNEYHGCTIESDYTLNRHAVKDINGTLLGTESTLAAAVQIAKKNIQPAKKPVDVLDMIAGDNITVVVDDPASPDDDTVKED